MAIANAKTRATAVQRPIVFSQNVFMRAVGLPDADACIATDLLIAPGFPPESVVRGETVKSWEKAGRN
jgi:hypothetical protein